MKRRLIELSVLLVLLAIGGALVVASGVVPVNASGGHWAITHWVLAFASSRSVAFHSRGIDVPELSEPGMITLGAATYDFNCRTCHGRPGLPQPAVAAKSTPRPPLFPEQLGDWEARELFYIIKHGIKFTGMPAWSTEFRDDEVWPVVSFLLAFKKMSEAEYQQQVKPADGAQPSQEAMVSRYCAACHGMDGLGRAGQRVPLVAGQSSEYIDLTLRAYRDGARHSGVMQPIAVQLDDAQIALLAAYYSSQLIPPVASLSAANNGTTELIEAGRKIASQGDRGGKVPSCSDCHGPAPIQRNNKYPRLAGQRAPYLRQQLALFNLRSRGGTNNANLMHPIADKLTQYQIDAVSIYYESAASE